MKRLSIIIPCYNESKNLPMLISRCKEVANKDSNIEIIIVDNAIEYSSFKLVKKLKKQVQKYRGKKRLTYNHRQWPGHFAVR